MRLLQHESVDSIRITETVEIIEGVEITVQDLPPDYGQRLREIMPEPRPRRLGPLKDDRGRIVREGKYPVYEYATDDPEYIKKLDERDELSLIFFVVEGIAEGQVEFSAKLADFDGNGIAWLRAVQREMIEFGWGQSQVKRVAVAVQALSDLTEEGIEEATEDFTDAATG